MVSNKFGWLGHYKERQSQSQLYDEGLLIDFRQWSDTENDLVVEGIDFPFDNGFAFWPIVKKVYGKTQVKQDAQSVGNCVPYSSCRAWVDRQCVEMLVYGDCEELFIPFVPYSYGAGRVYVGGVNWSGHGSLGGWQIKADMQHGLLPTDTPGVPIRYPDDIQGSASTNTSWMRSRSTLDKWKPYAIEFTVGEGSRITSFEQLKIAVCDKKQSVTIASNWGFKSRGLDPKYGIVIHAKSGSWAHMMHIRGVFEIKGQWFCYVGNQWGDNAHPKVADGYPLGGFVVTDSTMSNWIGSAEVYVRGSINGRTLKPNFSFL